MNKYNSKEILKKIYFLFFAYFILNYFFRSNFFTNIYKKNNYYVINRITIAKGLFTY